MKEVSKVKSKTAITKIRKVAKLPIKKDTKKTEAKAINGLTKAVKVAKKTDDIDLIFSKKNSTTTKPETDNDIDLIFSSKKKTGISTTNSTLKNTNANKGINGKNTKPSLIKKSNVTENNSEKLLSLLGTKKSKKKATTKSSDKANVNDNSKVVIASSGAKKPKNVYKPKDDDGFGDSRGLHSGNLIII